MRLHGERRSKFVHLAVVKAAHFVRQGRIFMHDKYSGIFSQFALDTEKQGSFILLQSQNEHIRLFSICKQ